MVKKWIRNVSKRVRELSKTLDTKKGPQNDRIHIQKGIPNKLTHITRKLGPQLLDLIFYQFRIPFWISSWTSILEPILYLILDSHFGSILVPTPHKMRVPAEIIRRSFFYGLACAIVELFLDNFFDAFWKCLGRLEIIKTCILNTYQVMILPPFR